MAATSAAMTKHSPEYHQERKAGRQGGAEPADRTHDPEWRSAFAALKKSLQAKGATGYRVGTIIEEDKYGDDPA